MEVLVVMTASEADAWDWSSGETTQSIEVTEAGVYSVSVVDICGNSGSSEEIEVELFDSPGGPPTIEDIKLTMVNSTFTAFGENIRWYDSETDGNLIGNGPHTERT